MLTATAVQSGDARDVIVGLEQVAAVTLSPMLRVNLRYARAVLSDDSAAGPLYADLMGQDLACWPWARARAELAYGGWLRRQHRYARAREVLRGAEISFARTGAGAWAVAPRTELGVAAVGMRADGNPRSSGTGR